MTDLEIVKEHYFFEQQRKSDLESALSTPVTVVALLAGSVTLLFPKLNEAPGLLGYALFSLIVLAAIAIVASFCFTVATFWRRNYSEVQVAEQFEHKAKLASFLEKAGKSDQLEAEFERDLTSRYLESVAHNSRVNHAKALSLYRVKFWLSVAAALVLLAFIPFAIISASEQTAEKECCHGHGHTSAEACRHDAGCNGTHAGRPADHR